MYDDEEATPSVALLMAVPPEQRREFQRLREMAALKGIELSPSTTDDGLVGFRIDRGSESVRCTDIDSLKTHLVEFGLPLLSAEELQSLLRAFQSAFIRAMDDAAGPHGDH